MTEACVVVRAQELNGFSRVMPLSFEELRISSECAGIGVTILKRAWPGKSINKSRIEGMLIFCAQDSLRWGKNLPAPQFRTRLKLKCHIDYGCFQSATIFEVADCKRHGLTMLKTFFDVAVFVSIYS